MSPTKLSANAAARNQVTACLAKVDQQIADAARQAGRQRQDICLLAVSKTQPLERMREAYAAGMRCFGESYLQEALSKIAALPDDCEWHFIGPIQSNKTRPIAEHFDWVHSVDRLKIAERLNAQRPEQRPPLKICVQVNVSGEASKSGCSPEELQPLLERIRDLHRLELRGLMCIPAASEDPAQQRAAFRRLRQLRDQYAPETKTLSMGMSGDLSAAVAEGSTIVRIGTALFGARAPSPGQT